MTKKLTYEYVKSFFTEEGYTLLSEEYVSAHFKLDYICPEGHAHSVTWANWYLGHRCPYCTKTIKCTIEEATTFFENEGYTLLSKSYKNAHTKLSYVCPNGHKGFITLNSWKKGNRCAKCFIDRVRNDLSEVKKSFEDEGYTLLSTEYKNAYTKLDFICPVGHIHSIKWNDWQQGRRCFYCRGNIKPTYEFVKSAFEKEGYILLSKVYKNNRTKLDYICPKGHKHNIAWDNWRSGQRCVYCSGKVKKSIDEVRAAFEDEGYVLLSTEYKNNRTRLDYLCFYKHEQSTTWGDWAGGHRCSVCASAKLMGEGNPSWRGGISLEPYCEAWKDKDYKASIRKRDDNVCLNPQCASKSPNDLTIHHIDYNKKNCHPSNLITVCRSCNGRANKDRKWHQSWYQAIMYRRYKYKY